VRELRPAVQRGERPPEQLELHRQHGAGTVLGIGLVVAHVAEPRTGEEVDVKLRGIKCLGVEPEIRRQ